MLQVPWNLPGRNSQNTHPHFFYLYVYYVSLGIVFMFGTLKVQSIGATKNWPATLIQVMGLPREVHGYNDAQSPLFDEKRQISESIQTYSNLFQHTKVIVILHFWKNNFKCIIWRHLRYQYFSKQVKDWALTTLSHFYPVLLKPPTPRALLRFLLRLHTQLANGIAWIRLMFLHFFASAWDWPFICNSKLLV